MEFFCLQQLLHLLKYGEECPYVYQVIIEQTAVKLGSGGEDLVQYKAEDKGEK